MRLFPLYPPPRGCPAVASNCLSISGCRLFYGRHRQCQVCLPVSEVWNPAQVWVNQGKTPPPVADSGQRSPECYDESPTKSRGGTCLPRPRDRSVSGARGTDGVSSLRAFRLSSPTAEILVTQLVLPPDGRTPFFVLKRCIQNFFFVGYK
jgi:hypothetical protein